MAYRRQDHDYPDLIRHIGSNYRRYPDQGQKYHSYPNFSSDSVSSTFPRPVKVDSYTVAVPEGYGKYPFANVGKHVHMPYGQSPVKFDRHMVTSPGNGKYPFTGISKDMPYGNGIPERYSSNVRRYEIPFREDQGYGTAITTQPISKIKQAARVKGTERPWDSSLFDCLDDINTCLCVSCCSPCYECYILPKEFNEHCCTGWPCCMGPGGTFLAIRYQMRKEENIEGDLLEDILTAMYCFPCMVCQLLREKRSIHKTTFKKSSDAAAVMGQRAAEAYNEMQRW